MQPTIDEGWGHLDDDIATRRSQTQSMDNLKVNSSTVEVLFDEDLNQTTADHFLSLKKDFNQEKDVGKIILWLLEKQTMVSQEEFYRMLVFEIN